jgi:hypothetical protein
LELVNHSAVCLADNDYDITPVFILPGGPYLRWSSNGHAGYHARYGKATATYPTGTTIALRDSCERFSEGAHGWFGFAYEHDNGAGSGGVDLLPTWCDLDADGVNEGMPPTIWVHGNDAAELTATRVYFSPADGATDPAVSSSQAVAVDCRSWVPWHP